jgi:ABC-type lipoprotein release transport system permease subunit
VSLFAALAWRNLWRNKRRSTIAMASVVFAVVIALATRSMQLGFYSRTIQNVVSFRTGYLQVHARGYQDEQSLENSFEPSAALMRRIERAPHVTVAAPRLEAFALLSGTTTTDGAQVMGIDPAREGRLTGLAHRLALGRYLEADDRGILLGSELARHLGVAPGDTLVVLGAGYHAQSAAGRFVVAGTLTFPIPELDASTAYLSLSAAQELLGAPGRVTSVAVMLDDPRALADVESRLRTDLGADFEVVSWKTMMPEMVQYIQVDNASGLLMLALVYVVIGFGILGTVLMMTMERTREFGVLIALGMPRRVLAGVVLLESVILGLLGAATGIAFGIPMLLYLAAHPIVLGGEAAQALRGYGFEPILPFSLDRSIFVLQTVTMLAIALAASILPLLRIRSLDPIVAMRRGL